MKTRILITCIFVLSLVFLVPQAFAFGVPPSPPDDKIIFQRDSPFSIIELGEQITIEKKVFNPFPDKETQIELKFFILDNQKKNPKLIGQLEDVLNFKNDRIYQQNYTSEKTGRFFASVELSYLYDERYNETQSFDFTVVEKISKAFESGRCKGELEPMLKPDYGSVVCISDPSKPKLQDRGWIIV